MKKKLLFFAAFVCAVSAAMGYSRKNEQFSEVGTIQSFGSMPLNFPGFVTDDGRQYLIEAEDSIKTELLGVQGKKILLTGTLVKKRNVGVSMNRLKDGAVKAVSFKIIEQE